MTNRQKRWRPINTAPKDGRAISVRGDQGPYGITKWEGVAAWGCPLNWRKTDSTWLEPKTCAVLHLAGYQPKQWAPHALGEKDQA
jgi:hypothetical protein